MVANLFGKFCPEVCLPLFLTNDCRNTFL